MFSCQLHVLWCHTRSQLLLLRHFSAIVCVPVGGGLGTFETLLKHCVSLGTKVTIRYRGLRMVPSLLVVSTDFPWRTFSCMVPMFVLFFLPLPLPLQPLSSALFLASLDRFPQTGVATQVAVGAGGDVATIPSLFCSAMVALPVPSVAPVMVSSVESGTGFFGCFMCCLALLLVCCCFAPLAWSCTSLQ